MRESASPLKPPTSSSKLSIRRKPMEWESGYPSAAPSSRLTMDIFRQQPMTGPELHFHLLSPADTSAWRRARLVPIRPIRPRMRLDPSLKHFVRESAIPKYNGCPLQNGALFLSWSRIREVSQNVRSYP